MAEQIVRIVRQRPQPYLPLDVGWLFAAMASLIDVNTIADKLDCSFSLIFCGTTCDDWARWVLGYRNDAILDYLRVILTLRNGIFQLLYSATPAVVQQWRLLLTVGVHD
jgi:hypothetical protein